VYSASSIRVGGCGSRGVGSCISATLCRHLRLCRCSLQRPTLTHGLNKALPPSCRNAPLRCCFVRGSRRCAPLRRPSLPLGFSNRPSSRRTNPTKLPWSGCLFGYGFRFGPPWSSGFSPAEHRTAAPESQCIKWQVGGAAHAVNKLVWITAIAAVAASVWIAAEVGFDRDPLVWAATAILIPVGAIALMIIRYRRLRRSASTRTRRRATSHLPSARRARNTGGQKYR
jgi:hypothetical protein